MEFYKRVLEEHKLSERERKALDSKIAGALKEITRNIRKSRLKADVVVGGSAAKGTLLKGDFDVDLFVRFDLRYKDSDLSELLGKILKPFGQKRLQGSRDYFQFQKEGVNYEVVPVLRIKDWREAVNVTDASPLHVTWVNKNIKKKPKLINEIILAKVLLKANRLYGAESYIGGFSGHVVDILIINYGGFMNFLRAASRWKPYTLVDVERHYKRKRPDLNQSKIGPLILIDPVQPQRNAAAAVNLGAFRRLVEVAKRFLKNPSPRYFEKSELTESRLRVLAGNNRLIILRLSLKKGKFDVNGARIVKTLEYIVSKLGENEFKVINSGWEWDKSSRAMIWVIMDRKPLDKVRIHAGPPLDKREHVMVFRRAYRKTFVKDGRVYAEVKRDYVASEKLVGELVKDDYIASRFRQIKQNQ